MKKLSIFLLTLGIISLVAMAFIFVFDNDKKENFVSDSKTFSECFDKMYIDTDCNDVNLIIEDRKNTFIEYVTSEKFTYEFSQETEGSKNILKVNQRKNKKIDFDFQKKNNSRIKIFIPKRLIENIVIKNSIGDINIKDLVCSSLEIDNNIGNISLNDINIKKLNIKLKIGNMNLNKIISDNVEISNFIGDILGNIFESKNNYRIISKTNIGDNNLVNNFDGEKMLKLKTNIGDINIDFKY